MQPPEPPVPISATWSALPLALIVTFNEPLTPGAINGASWEANHAGIGYTGGPPADVVGAVATIRMTNIGIHIDVDHCHYFATPPDIISLQTGETTVPFDDFPIT